MELEVGALTGGPMARRAPSGRPTNAIATETGRKGGDVELANPPQTAQGLLTFRFLEPRRVAEKALTAVGDRKLHQGASTRSVDRFGQVHGHTASPRGRFYRAMQEIDERRRGLSWSARWKASGLFYGSMPATYSQSPPGRPHRSVAVTIAVGVNTAPRPARKSWPEIGLSEARRPLDRAFRAQVGKAGPARGKMVISDAHEEQRPPSPQGSNGLLAALQPINLCRGPVIMRTWLYKRPGRRRLLRWE